MPFSKSHPILWNTVVLSYGSLVYKYCASTQPCPVGAVQVIIYISITSHDVKKKRTQCDFKCYFCEFHFSSHFLSHVHFSQPLLDFAADGFKRGSEVDMVLALKALGNAGHPSSIKTIMRFLPGVSAAPVTLPACVLSAAVQSMRHLAVRDPHSVRRASPYIYQDTMLQTA